MVISGHCDHWQPAFLQASHFGPVRQFAYGTSIAINAATIYLFLIECIRDSDKINEFVVYRQMAGAHRRSLRWTAVAVAAVAAVQPTRTHSSSFATYTPTNGVLNSTDWALWLTAHAALGISDLILAAGNYAVPEPASSAQAHVVLPALNGVLLDCTNVELMLTNRRKGAVYLSGWQNVTLQGLQIRYAEPTSNSAAIVAINTTNPSVPTIDVVVEAGTPTDDFEAGLATSCDVFSPDLRLLKPATWDPEIVATVPLPGPPANAFRLTLGNIGQLDNVVVGDLLGCRVSNGQMTFHVDGAENSTFRDISLYGGPVFGYFHTGSSLPGQRGRNVFERIAVRFPDAPAGAPGRPLLSTSADGFHCAEVQHGPIIRDSYFEGMNDDGIAIHGIYSLITDADAVTGRVWIASNYGTASYSVGDMITIYDGTFSPQPPSQPPFYPRNTFTITGIASAAPNYKPPRNTSHTDPGQPLGPGQTTFLVLNLTTSTSSLPNKSEDVDPASLPPGIAFDWILADVSRAGDGFQLINNTIANHRARGMLIKASDGVIINNTIVNSSMGGIIVTPELYWREADFAHNLLLANNTIIGVGRALQGYGGIALGAVDPDNKLAAGPGHGNITIANNTLIDVGYAPIWLSSAGNVSLENNRVITPFHAPSNQSNALPTCCEPVLNFVAVYATNVVDLSASGNCVQAAPPADSSLQSIVNFTATVTGDFADGVAAGC